MIKDVNIELYMMFCLWISYTKEKWRKLTMTEYPYNSMYGKNLILTAYKFDRLNNKKKKKKKKKC
jgi:hypothetical protein